VSRNSGRQRRDGGNVCSFNPRTPQPAAAMTSQL
jgi:hypothetical protein